MLPKSQLSEHLKDLLSSEAQRPVSVLGWEQSALGLGSCSLKDNEGRSQISVVSQHD